MTWFRRSKQAFDRITSHYPNSKLNPKPETRNPLPIINHRNVPSFPSLLLNRSSHGAHIRVHIGVHIGYRCYHVDRKQVRSKPIVTLVFYVSSALIATLGLEIGVLIWVNNVETIPYTNRKHLLLVTPDVERNVAVPEFEKRKAGFGDKVLPVMHPDCVRVTMILKRVIRALKKDGPKLAISHLEGVEWEVFVVKNDAVYAYVMNNGKIVVYTGLLERFPSDEEVATVIGHEVAHIVARHPAEELTKMILRYYGRHFYMFVRPDPDSTLKSYLPFSHRMETEADHIGLLLMASAGYDPRVAPKVYEKMGQIDSDSGLKNDLSTHPSGKERSKLLSEPSSVMKEAISKYEEAIARQDVD